MCLPITLIIVFFIGIGLQIGFQFFSPLLLLDDLTILTNIKKKLMFYHQIKYFEWKKRYNNN